MFKLVTMAVLLLRFTVPAKVLGGEERNWRRKNCAVDALFSGAMQNFAVLGSMVFYEMAMSGRLPR